ncbi:MAG: DUF5060 domain-containing protein [Cyclobacteriaceae bacterium]
MNSIRYYFLATLVCFSLSIQAEANTLKGTTISQWELLDITFNEVVKSDNPFVVDFGAMFIHENGDTIKAPGFYNGDNDWVVRFSSSQLGSWRYTTFGPKPLSGKKGKITVNANSDKTKHGAVTLSEDDPQHFYYEDGTPYYLLAFECDWLFALDYHNESNLPKSKHLLNLLKENGINQIVMNVFSYNVSWPKDEKLQDHPEHEFGGSPDIFPFLGNNDQPDFTSLNVDFFKKLDRTIALMAEYNMDAHLMIYVWNKLVSWPDMYSDADNMYFDYVVKRYQAYHNVIFDISKEALFYGRADEAYILERIERVRSLDQFGRLLSVHDFGFCKRNPDKVDFISTQNWSWDIYNKMLEAGREFKNKPIFNIEHGGYEESPYTVFPGAYTDPEVCLRRNYACVFAGAYSTYYWQAAAWNVIIYNPFEQHESFVKPKFSYYKHLANFFREHPYVNYEPSPWRNGSSYSMKDKEGNFIFYVHKDNYKMPTYWLSQHKDKTVSTQWFNTLTGEYTKAQVIDKNAEQISPWRGEADAILLIDLE